jgi:cytoskeletal protein RodZ
MPVVDTAAFTTWLERGDAEIGLEDVVRFDLPESVPVRRVAPVPRWPLAVLALLVVGVVVAAVVMAVRARTSDSTSAEAAPSAASLPAAQQAPTPTPTPPPATMDTVPATSDTTPTSAVAPTPAATSSTSPTPATSTRTKHTHRTARTAAAASPTQGKLEMKLSKRYAITLDGKPTGLHTPQGGLALAVGTHRVTLVDDKGTRRTIEITVEAGKTTRLHDFSSP